MVYLPGEEGQGLAEYGLILVLIALIVVAALTLIGPEISAFYVSVAQALQ